MENYTENKIGQLERVVKLQTPRKIMKDHQGPSFPSEKIPAADLGLSTMNMIRSRVTNTLWSDLVGLGERETADRLVHGDGIDTVEGINKFLEVEKQKINGLNRIIQAAQLVYIRSGISEVTAATRRAEKCGCRDCQKIADQISSWYFKPTPREQINEPETRAIEKAKILFFASTKGYVSGDSSGQGGTIDLISTLSDPKTEENHSVGKLLLGEDLQR